MNIRNYRSTDYIKELRRLLDWPIPWLKSKTHHAGRARALAWVVTGIDFGDNILKRKLEVEDAIRATEFVYKADL